LNVGDAPGRFWTLHDWRGALGGTRQDTAGVDVDDPLPDVARR
jgi:hypothetical protein